MNRAEVVREALEWLGTPFHHMARVKGEGTDCGQFPLAVFEAVGLIPPHDPGFYPPDWHKHRDEERWLNHAEQFTVKVSDDEPALPGDLVLFRYGRTVSHGAIVLQWPQVIHAYIRRGVILDDVEKNADLRERFVGVWRLKEWA